MVEFPLFVIQEEIKKILNYIIRRWNMADKSMTWEDNVPGSWYVDKNCILCGVCIDVAPNNFKEAESSDHAFIVKQPSGDEEISACKDAMDQCPVEAIGNN